MYYLHGGSVAGGGEEPGRERRGGVMIRQGSSLCDFCSFSVFCVVLGFLVQGTQQAGSEITEFGGSIRPRTLIFNVHEHRRRKNFDLECDFRVQALGYFAMSLAPWRGLQTGWNAELNRQTGCSLSAIGRGTSRRQGGFMC